MQGRGTYAFAIVGNADGLIRNRQRRGTLERWAGSRHLRISSAVRDTMQKYKTAQSHDACGPTFRATGGSSQEYCRDFRRANFATARWQLAQQVQRPVTVTMRRGSRLTVHDKHLCFAGGRVGNAKVHCLSVRSSRVELCTIDSGLVLLVLPELLFLATDDSPLSNFDPSG